MAATGKPTTVEIDLAEIVKDHRLDLTVTPRPDEKDETMRRVRHMITFILVALGVTAVGITCMVATVTSDDVATQRWAQTVVAMILSSSLGWFFGRSA